MYEPVKKHSRPAKAKSRSNKKKEGGDSE
jgi:hypothetical protein